MDRTYNWGAKRSSRAGIATIHLFSSVRNRHKNLRRSGEYLRNADDDFSNKQ